MNWNKFHNKRKKRDSVMKLNYNIVTNFHFQVEIKTINKILVEMQVTYIL